MEGDRRVRKTRARLRLALVELLREKPAEEISVTELTGRADVNRGTFYLHYRDIYDMVEQLEEELFQELRRLLDAYPADMLRSGLRPVLRDVFDFVTRNLDLVDSFLDIRRGETFLKRLTEVLREKVARDWEGLYRFADEGQRDYCLAFFVGGTIGLVQSWLNGRRREGPEEMAVLAEQMILRGLGERNGGRPSGETSQ